jgi:hypothetical protein
MAAGEQTVTTIQTEGRKYNGDLEMFGEYKHLRPLHLKLWRRSTVPRCSPN